MTHSDASECFPDETPPPTESDLIPPEDPPLTHSAETNTFTTPPEREVAQDQSGFGPAREALLGFPIEPCLPEPLPGSLLVPPEVLRQIPPQRRQPHRRREDKTAFLDPIAIIYHRSMAMFEEINDGDAFSAAAITSYHNVQQLLLDTLSRLERLNVAARRLDRWRQLHQATLAALDDVRTQIMISQDIVWDNPDPGITQL